MKIGLVCPYNMYRGGGVQEVVLALKDGINARGHEAYIITPQPRGEKEDRQHGIIFVGGSVPFRAARTESAISASRGTNGIDSMLDREQFDILHFHEPWNPMLAMQIMMRSDSIHVATFHAAMSERLTSRTVEKVITPYTRSILKYIDVMTAVSNTAAKYVRTLTDQKVHIIGNGIDLSKYKPADNRRFGRTKTILYVGRLEKRKGLPYLLEAFALLREAHPNFKLVIAGEGPERSKLEYMIEDNNIENVEFLGYIEESEKLRWLQKADLFCSPALHGESFGIVILEAMASGCVAVAGNNGGYEGVLSGRGQLSIVNPKDTTEFARRLALMATDDGLRKLWLDWAKHEVENYNYDRIIDQYMEVYETEYAKRHAVKQPA